MARLFNKLYDFSNWAPHNYAFVMNESGDQEIFLNVYVQRLDDSCFDVLRVTIGLYRFYSAENVKVFTGDSKIDMFGILQPGDIYWHRNGVALVLQRVRHFRIDNKEVKVGKDVEISGILLEATEAGESPAKNQEIFILLVDDPKYGICHYATRCTTNEKGQFKSITPKESLDWSLESLDVSFYARVDLNLLVCFDIQSEHFQSRFQVAYGSHIEGKIP